MATFTLKSISFTYAGSSEYALNDLSLTVERGAFFVLCGPSGCGKSTLLRLLKPQLTPHGIINGSILFDDLPIESYEQKELCSRIGFVMQSPDAQIVTDKVWHELAFGAESLGWDNEVIRRRVAETASFFGMQTWFHKNVSELSGGQKQLLNLASVMVMQPDVLILDEPTSQLDPIAAADFLAILAKLNREIGTTILISEHRLEETFPYASDAAVMENGRILCAGKPSAVGTYLREQKHGMFLAMPAAMRIWSKIKTDSPCPITVREGKDMLNSFASSHGCDELQARQSPIMSDEIAIQANEVWFRYEKGLPDTVKGLSFNVPKGLLYALLGGNGSGKTTTLKLAASLLKPYRGTIQTYGKTVLLPQDPQTLFVKNTVYDDLFDMLRDETVTLQEKNDRIAVVCEQCRISQLADRHPYDLSGGEQQRAALAKLLLCDPDILLLDEPTKGLDAEFKAVFADILKELTQNGKTVLMVSHDIEFCADNADCCAMFFDGSIVTEAAPREFFSGNSYYTTAANRMARHLLPNAVTVHDVIFACTKTVVDEPHSIVSNAELKIPEKKQASLLPIEPISRRSTSNRRRFISYLPLLLIPFTLLLGTLILNDRKYYFTSLLILLEIISAFYLQFERKKPSARYLVTVASLCAVAIAGRAAFFMLPQCKPVLAVTILAGIALGSETGFLVGSVTMLLSNMLFSQGPWTPWQMAAMGLIGWLAGILFRKKLLPCRKLWISVFGAISAIIPYGVIMNAASALIWADHVTLPILLSYYVTGFPMDCVHAAATAIFLFFGAEPLLEKLNRVIQKFEL
ncbi:MAG: ATP-binding cassette domain-containing protein [Clostridiales bacterium]|nr:ATP-binding cassette domain-containing protein [Clostridiales bacterium]